MDTMKRKTVSLILIIASFFSVLILPPVGSSAKYYSDYQLYELESEMDEKCEEILHQVYHDEYWDGGCAEWTSDQLKLNEIGYWYRGYNSYGYDDGYDWFAGLDDGAVTDYGYTQVKYPGEGCLYDLIYEFGGYPIFNVVVSWELGNNEWVASGHVIYIWCIYDGYVYYADTFDQFLHKAGHIIKQPVDEFLAIYTETSGALLGAVHFEGAEEVHFKPDEDIYAVYEVKEDCGIYFAPMYEQNGDDARGGSAATGERFNVKGAYNGEDGSRWYKIEGGMWIEAKSVKKVSNASTLAANGINVPDYWCYHQGFDLIGTVISYSSDIKKATLKITDLEGNIFAGGDFEPDAMTFSVGIIDEDTYFEHLKPGKYRFYLSAENDYESKVFVDSEFEIATVTYNDSTYHTVSSERSEFPVTDCNIDGTVDAKDLDFVRGHILSSGAYAQYFADVNGDGTVNLTDYAAVALALKATPHDSQLTP